MNTLDLLADKKYNIYMRRCVGWQRWEDLRVKSRWIKELL